MLVSRYSAVRSETLTWREWGLWLYISHYYPEVQTFTGSQHSPSVTVDCTSQSWPQLDTEHTTVSAKAVGCVYFCGTNITGYVFNTDVMFNVFYCWPRSCLPFVHLQRATGPWIVVNLNSLVQCDDDITRSVISNFLTTDSATIYIYDLFGVSVNRVPIDLDYNISPIRHPVITRINADLLSMWYSEKMMIFESKYLSFRK